MNYMKACEILGLTTPKSFEENAILASGILARMNSSTPLRYKVSARTIINAAKTTNQGQ